MDHSKHIPMSQTELTAANLEGANVYGPGDDKIGSISHLHGTPPSAQAVLDVGGFLGIGAKTVAIDLSRLSFMRDEAGEPHATTMMTKDELKELPEHHH